MKKLKTIFAIMFAFACIKMNAQTNTFPTSGSAGIGTIAPNVSSILDVTSTTKGMLVPRMTKTQRDAIATPATGLLIFQTNSTPGFYYYSGVAWTALKPGSASKTLNNLTGPTAINRSLLPAADSTNDLGSITASWKDIYADGKVYLNGDQFINNPGLGNSFVGVSAGINSSGTSNTFVGQFAGLSSSTGSANSFFGSQSGKKHTTGFANAFFGDISGYENTNGSNNSFFGHAAGFSNIDGSYNSFFGHQAGSQNTASRNCFFGAGTGGFNTAGEHNAFFGQASGGSNTTASYNSFFGFDAGALNTIGNSNSFFGNVAGRLNNSGTNNSFFGDSAGFSNTTGDYNAFFGKGSGILNTTAYANSFYGSLSGNKNTVGIQNSFFGFGAGQRNTTASGNSFYGYQSGVNTTTGTSNSFFGRNSGEFNTTGFNNTFFGESAGLHNISGSRHSAVGYHTCESNTAGIGLTAIGYESGASGTADSYCTFIGYNSDNVTNNNLSNANAFGYQSRVTAANTCRIGNAVMATIGGFEDWTNVSDGRYKKNVTENVKGLEFINRLRPVTYNLDVTGLKKFMKEDDDAEMPESVKKEMQHAIDTKEKQIKTGFIAQEVEAAAKESGYDFSGVDKPQNVESLYGLRYAEFTVPLVKAVQELSKLNDNKDEKIEALKSEIENLKSCVELLCNKSDQRQSSGFQLPTSNLLFQNSPNPFSEKTMIRCQVNSDFTSAKIIIRNLEGVLMMEQNISSKGNNAIEINARTLASGTYTYTLEVNNVSVDTKLMVVTK